MFDTIAMVDWSGGQDRGPKPRPDSIFLCVARGDQVEVPIYLRNRAVAMVQLADLIANELAAGRRLLIGFDFPFGYPEGFAALVTGAPDPLALADWFAAALPPDAPDDARFHIAAELNARLGGNGPFWFRFKNGPEGLPLKKPAWLDRGFLEKRHVETLAPGAFLSWQMGGAGSVGSQTMTGMAALSRLRRWFPGQVGVWPFELDCPVMLVEIWPSLIDATVKAHMRQDEIKDAAQVRVLACAVAQMVSEGALAAVLDDVDDGAPRSEEGWILGVRQPNQLADAAERALAA
ncbi:MAG: molybdopterin guanine dinucleotide synthesis [Pseudomonadota bacterium]